MSACALLNYLVVVGTNISDRLFFRRWLAGEQDRIDFVSTAGRALPASATTHVPDQSTDPHGFID